MLHAPNLPAQKISVAVDITDSAANRVFQGAFTQAFRSLGDVVVVSLEERPEYVLTGVVICEPASCQNPSHYSASLRFWSPSAPVTAEIIAGRLVPRLPAGTFRFRRDSVANLIVWPLLKNYETTYNTWVAEWGRDRYEQGVREFVRRIDTDCFEHERAYSRALANTDSSVSNSLMREIDSRKWLC